MTTSVALTCGRAALGICLMIAPRLIGRVWVIDTDTPSVDHLARIVGVREMALAASPWLIAGTGTADSSMVRRQIFWLGVVCDTWDAATALASSRALPGPRRAVAVTVALAGAAAGTTAALLHPRHSAGVPAGSAIGSSGCAQTGALRP
jgi:hypothetical protein